MNTVLVYDGQDADAKGIIEVLKPLCGQSGSMDCIDVASLNLNDCTGCFGCWLKTPGLCMFGNDDGNTMLETILRADYLVLLSRIVWGGYSLPLKACADRMLPMLHPYFKVFNKEMHHQLRYRRTPDYLVVGYGAGNREEEQTFLEYTRAHRDNMSSDREEGSWIVGTSEKKSTGFAALQAWFRKEIAA